MTGISGTGSVGSYQDYSTQISKTDSSTNTASKASSASQTTASSSVKSAKTVGQSASYGKTIGNVSLSEEGAKYYEELKKKFSNMDFILVSKDQKATAQANAASYANTSKMVVLIDEEKIERMATDENFRKQYEAIISNASSGLSQLKSSIQSAGLSGSVQGYGMQVNDGGLTSFFAVLKKSSEAQKERIEKKAEEKKAEKKEEAKKAEKEEKEEKLQKSRDKDADEIDDEDTITITANSIEELMRKINDYVVTDKSDNVQTESEKLLGQNIDFRG
jgi:hypothetical protein